MLFVDEDELAQATGDPDASLAVARVLALGPAVVVVKRGARGAWMQRRDGAPVATAAAPVREVVDTTGAGDAFAGALVGFCAIEAIAIHTKPLSKYIFFIQRILNYTNPHVFILSKLIRAHSSGAIP